MHSLAQYRHRFGFWASLTLLGGVSPGHASPSQAAPLPANHSEAIAGRDTFAHAVSARRAAITQENARAPSVAWAGDYYSGDGLGANVSMSLAPRAGVAASWQGCLGTYATNEGNVVEQADGSLRLRYERPNDPKGIGFADHVVPVAWGERMYLVPEKELPAFASAVNLGDEPREGAQGSFLMRDGDDRREVRGLPELPPAQRSLLHDAPLEVRVLSSERLHDTGHDRFECQFRLELDRGTDDGLAAGMYLDPAGGSSGHRLDVERATATRSVGTTSLFGDECSRRSLQPSTDTRFTTGAYRGAPSSAKP